MTGILDHLLRGGDLAEMEAADLVPALVGPGTDPALAGALLAALRAKGETAAELRGFVRAMRRMGTKVRLDAGGAVDLTGTGGDRSGSLNLSTGSAILAAACGLRVIKHGNRAVSSRSGSADVLEALGMALPDGEAQAREALERTGFTFLFAPTFHPAMKALSPVRRALGVRTVFNLLGPLLNPAEPPFAVVGSFDEPSASRLAAALSGLGVERAFVVHGAPGWDEATPAGPFVLWDVRPGVLRQEVRDPATCGLPRCDAEALRGGDALENARRLREALCGGGGPHADALCLGAALALEVAGAAPSMAAGLARAAEAIATGAAERLLDSLTEGAHA